MKKITVEISDEAYDTLLKVQMSLKMAALKLEPDNRPLTTLAAAAEYCIMGSAWAPRSTKKKRGAGPG